MRRFDIVCVGAGLAAFGALAALVDRTAGRVRPSVLLVDGEALNDPGVALSTLGPPDRRGDWSARHFGLPAVRAFGDGGTSSLWHGGLFVPHPADEVRIAAPDATGGVRFDIAAALDTLCASPSLARLDVLDSLREVQALAGQAAHGRPDDAWRSVLIPVRPPFLAPGRWSRDNEAGAPWLTSERGAVVALAPSPTGGWVLRLVRENGFESIAADRVLLCAGCLASTALLASAAGLSDGGAYSDHLHVFVGVLAKRHLDAALRERLTVTRDGAGRHSLRRLWKTTLDDATGQPVDVSLSFRAVANPDFPRAGRRFGEFVGSRASSRLAKVMLGLKNPLTAVEMVGYKHGVELPFEHVLVHATIAPRRPVGRVAPGRLTFEPERDPLGRCGLQALERFGASHGLDGRALRAFSHDDVSASLISGAQFCAGRTLPAPLADWLRARGDTLRVCDTAGMAYTSIYNQGLLSLVRGYALAADLPGLSGPGVRS